MRRKLQCPAAGSKIAENKLYVRKMSKDRLRTNPRRKEVFEAAAKIIAGSRSGAFTLDEIADCVGGSKGTIYYYFKSKGDLLYQLSMYFIDLMDEAVSRIINDNSIPPKVRLEKVIRAHIRTVCEHWQLSRSLWSDIGLKEAPKYYAGIIVRERNAYSNAVRELIRQIIEVDKINCLEPKIATLLIFGTIASISRWYQKGKGLSVDEMVEITVNSIFNGIFQ